MISENIKKMMKERKISGTELSKRLGVSNQTISAWVNGKKIPRMKMLVDLAEALECPLTALVDPDPTSYRQELDNVLYRLSESQIEEVLNYALYLEKKDEKK